jgi:hypothetical protein
MRVHKPSNNAITQGYSAGHRGYDFAGNGLPDEVRAGKSGTIIERVDTFTTNWRTTGALTTRDYGNYIKIKHDDGGFELHAHLRKGSSLVEGTKVTAGQIVARIGNTGNSTGPHLHSEYRNASSINQVAEFYTGGGDSNMNDREYRNLYWSWNQTTAERIGVEWDADNPEKSVKEVWAKIDQIKAEADQNRKDRDKWHNALVQVFQYLDVTFDAGKLEDSLKDARTKVNTLANNQMNEVAQELRSVLKKFLG